MQSNIARSATLNGLFIGLLLSLKFIFSVTKSNLLAFLSFGISIYIVFALYNLTVRIREKEFEGLIKYRQSFHYILQIYFYGSVISSLIMLIYTKFIDASYLENMLNAQLKLYDTFKIHMDDQTYNLLEKFYKPATFALGNIVGSLIIGTFWGLILGAFIKKEKSIFEE
jgi:hypothetical protein